MFFNQGSTCVLKAKLANAVVASQLKINVTYRDNTDEFQPDVIVDTNNTTAVMLLDAPSGSVVNIVELIKIYNPDTQANTVQILANDTVISTFTIGPGQTILISEECISNGLGYTPANVDLSNITAAGQSTLKTICAASPTVNTGIGQIVYSDFGNNNPAVAPTGGTWLFLNKMQVNISTGIVYNYGTDNVHWPGAIIEGGTTVTNGRSGYSTFAVFWRIT